MKSIDWPTDESDFWWMRYKRTPRSKTNILLVTVVKHDGEEFIQPHQDNNCYPRSFAAEWNARFIPCETPPVFD